jgi:hypothetical protein
LALLTVLHVLRVVLYLNGHGVEVELPLEAGAGHLQHSLRVCVLSWGERRTGESTRELFDQSSPLLKPHAYPQIREP